LASARLFAQKHLADQAITEAALAIGISPSNISAHLLRGAAYLEIARDADALADAKEAIRLGDTSALVFAIQGRAHLHLGRLEQAKNDLDNATLLDPQWIPDRDEAKRRLTASTASKSSPSSSIYAVETAGLVEGLEQDSNGLEFLKRNKWWFLAGLNLLVIILALFIYQARKRYFL
jgi:tetratricopeptide (TPR) repeat protein